LVGTSTVCQGSARSVGIANAVGNGWHITRAVRIADWPGTASVKIAKVWMTRSPTHIARNLNGAPVDRICSLLRAADEALADPPRIDRRKVCYMGAVLAGSGFIVSAEERIDLLGRSPHEAEVLQMLINGSDLNSSPDQSSDRFVINFSGMTLEE